jgi:hypothetical protein
MTQSEEILFRLLRAGLWTKEADIPQEFDDWSEIIRLAKHQSVLGIVAKAILTSTASVDIPKELKAKLRSLVVTNVIASNHIDEVIIKLFNVLKCNGIHPVLLKGRGLSVNYPYPEIRQSGDIDIYIPQAELHKAYDLLEIFADKIDDRLHLDCGKHFSALYKSVCIEIHRYVSTHINGKYGKKFGTFAKKGLRDNLGMISIGTEEISVPETTFNSFYVFDHLFEHFLTSGVGLRQMSDWMLFLSKNKENIDKNLLYDMLKTMDMLKPWKQFGNVLVDYLGLPASDFPFYEPSDRTEDILKNILQDGNFGKDSAYYKNRSRTYIGRKLKSFWWHMHRGAKMIVLYPKLQIRHFVFIVENAVQYIITHYKAKRKA